MREWMRIVALLAFVLMGPRLAMSQALVAGEVDEQDGVTPIENATVTFSGIDVLGDTVVYRFLTDSLGCFSDSINAGVYRVWASAEGYQTVYQADSLEIEDGQFFFGLSFVLHETYHPVNYVAARQYTNDLARVSWSMSAPVLTEDFETGDFSRVAWKNDLSDYPWTIDTLHAHLGRCCMKSGCEGAEGGTSRIEVSVYVPMEGQMGFFSKISSESSWDLGRFYLDGVKKMECSGEEDWTEFRFDITRGEHVFRWDYVKDATVNVGDDCFYVDDIRFYIEDSARLTRSFQYYDLFRSRLSEEPVLMASHLTDTVFMDMNWGSLPWGQYRWGVSACYEGNRGHSDTIWSTFLDKDMTTTLEIQATTNAGLQPVGATVSLTSHSGQGNEYQATLNANGYVLLPAVYRDSYDIRVHLDGFLDYVSDSAVSVFEPTRIEVELSEETNGIDSLYVSSTGWAIWTLGSSQNRDLLYYEIMLDGEVVGTTTAATFQFDVSSLNEGDTCTAQVRPVYHTDVCEWISCLWVYRPCGDFPGCSSLAWALNGEALLLSWNYPEGDFLGAILSRDGEFLAFTEGSSFVDETVTLHGEVEYCLRLVYDGPTDGTYGSMSCEECIVAVFLTYCDPPVKLDGTTYHDNDDDHGALISWGERPEPVDQWLYYDDGIFKRTLGGEEPRIFWAIRFEADDLVDYVGMTLRKVSIYDAGAGTYQLWIYVGGDTAPRTLVRSQNMSLTNTQAWHVETVSPAYEIPPDEPLWIVVGQQGLARPAAACQDTGRANGRWVSLDGETWTDMHSFNMHYTWMLRAFVTNQAGRTAELDLDGFNLQQYNLYRSFNNTEFQQIASIPAIDGQLYYEYRDNLAEDDHEDVYYRLTAFYLADNGETCESDYAATLNNPDQNYVAIDLTSTNEYQSLDFKLYPNPTSNQITIELEGMQKLRICNTLGQVLLVRQVKSNIVQFDLSAFENGVYWLQVATQNTVTAKTFILSR